MIKRRLLAVVLFAVFAAIAVPNAFALSTVPDSTWRTNGAVRSMTRIGDTIYLGGKFTALVSPSGQQVGVQNLAAISSTTGDPILTWRPNANDVVWALTNDGTRVIAGGNFTAIDGQSQTRLAAIDGVSATLDPTWKGKANSRVNTLSIQGTQIFAGGMFGFMNGKARKKMAVLNLDGSLSSIWANHNFTAQVRGFGFSPDGTQVYVGGDFYTVDTVQRVHIARFDVLTGALDAWAPNENIYLPADCSNKTPCDWAQNITTNGNRVFVGFCGGKNRIDALDATTGARVWRMWTSGDVKSQTQWNGSIIIAGHFHHMHFDQVATEYDIQYVAMLDFNGNPNTSWVVKIDKEKMFDGVYALQTDGDGPGSHLWMGGNWRDSLGFFNGQSFLARFTF